MKRKPLYNVGSLVRFDFCWYGRENPHNGHLCRVVESRIDRNNGRDYHRYTLEDLDWTDGARGRKVFKTTNSSANGTTLTLVVD